MRGKLSDQDLTNYALNELESHERLYVESILAVSEECRADVYDMIEMGQMLQEGFEAENVSADRGLALRPEQRGALLSPARRPLVATRNAAALLASAACLGLFLTHPGLWPERRPTANVAQVSTGSAAEMMPVSAAESSTMAATSIPQESWWTLMDERSRWVDDAVSVCTPPQWLDIESQSVSAVGLTDLGGMAY